MEEILIPMECLYDIPSLNQMAMKSYKKGEIFMFNPNHEVHVELEEHGVFKDVDNSLCTFICEIELKIGDKYYQPKEIISADDVKLLDENAIKNLCLIGYIKKILNKKTNTKKSDKDKSKIKKAKKTPSETYSTLARKLGKSSTEFKKACLDVLGIEVKDLRKKVPLKELKKIIGALK